MLEQLEGEENNLDTVLVARQQQLELDMALVEEETAQKQADITKTIEENSNEVKELRTYLANLEAENAQTKAYLEAIKTLLNIESISAGTNKGTFSKIAATTSLLYVNADGQLQLSVVLPEIACTLTMADDKRIINIEVFKYFF
jgi:type I site-specific restriction endonuclease